MLDRKHSPTINSLSQIDIALPERRKMRNGIPLSIINAGEQEVVRFDLIIHGGRYQQWEPLQALMTNRMLREGSTKYSSAEIAEKLDYYGAWLELSSSMEHSYLTLYSLNKYFAQTLEIVESIVKDPIFPEKELRTTLDINKQQLLVNSTKVDFVSQKYFNLSVFGVNHPSGRAMVADDYNHLDRRMLQEFYRKYFHSGNASVYISGRVSSDIIAQIESAFGNSPWGDTSNLFEEKTFEVKPTGEKRLFVERPDALQSSIRIGGPTIDRFHPDSQKMRVLTTLFGGYFGSRLMSNIREDKGYTYGISAGIMFYPGVGLLQVSTEADNTYVEDIVREVYHEMEVLKTELVSDEELQMVKNYLLGNMCRSYEGPFSIADAWIYVDTGKLSDTYFKDSLEAVQTVTNEELRELSQKYFQFEELTEVIAGKKIT